MAPTCPNHWRRWPNLRYSYGHWRTRFARIGIEHWHQGFPDGDAALELLHLQQCRKHRLKGYSESQFDNQLEQTAPERKQQRHGRYLELFSKFPMARQRFCPSAWGWEWQANSATLIPCQRFEVAARQIRHDLKEKQHQERARQLFQGERLFYAHSTDKWRKQASEVGNTQRLGFETIIFAVGWPTENKGLWPGQAKDVQRQTLFTLHVHLDVSVLLWCHKSWRLARDWE